MYVGHLPGTRTCSTNALVFSAQTNSTTWFDKLSTSGQLSSDVFSFYLKGNSTNESEVSGHMVFR